MLSRSKCKIGPAPPARRGIRMACIGANLAPLSASGGRAQGPSLRRIGTSLILALMLFGAAAAPAGAEPLAPEAARAGVQAGAVRGVEALRRRHMEGFRKRL